MYDKVPTQIGTIASGITPVTQYPCDTIVTGGRRCADDNGTDEGGEQGAGKSLKAVGEGNGTDDFGFSAPLAGYRGIAGGFVYSGSNANVWSASQNSSTNAWRRNLNSGNSTVNRNTNNKNNGFSLRCLQH